MSHFKSWAGQFDWGVMLFLLVTPIIAAVGIPFYVAQAGWPVGILVFTLIFAALTNLSVTAGYHRLFSHKSYDAHPLARAFFLLVASSGWQGSALKWSSDHRRHHMHIDGEKDPYNIHRGFMFAHMGWLFRKETVSQDIHAPDLQKDWMVSLQHRFYIPIALFTGFAFPTLVGWAMGSAWGGFLFGGVLRIVLTQHSTFFVNSLCHTLGRQTYCKDISARDSLFVAFLTHGEGYHNFHHKFQIDYRNGIRWYQWDPTKWVIISLKNMGLAHKLRQVSAAEILKARLHAEEAQLIKSGMAEEILKSTKEKILVAQDKIKSLKEDYARLKTDYTKKRDNFKEQYENRITQIKKDLDLAKLELQYGLKQWKIHLRSV